MPSSGTPNMNFLAARTADAAADGRLSLTNLRTVQIYSKQRPTNLRIASGNCTTTGASPASRRKAGEAVAHRVEQELLDHAQSDKGPEQGARANLVVLNTHNNRHLQACAKGNHRGQQAVISGAKARPQAYGSSPATVHIDHYQQAVHTDADPQWCEHANAHTTEGT